MMIVVAVFLAVGAVSAIGSGPYLPSGWKPQGPAFYLPSEVQKSPDTPIKETLFQDTEASGSDALREYGPPKLQEVSQDLSNQGLPDVVTEQTFVSIETKLNQEGAADGISVEESQGTEVNTEEEIVIVEEIQTATESIATAFESQAIVEESLATATESQAVVAESLVTATESQAILVESRATATESQLIAEEINTETVESTINAETQTEEKEISQSLQEVSEVVTEANIAVIQQESEAIIASVEENVVNVETVVEEIKTVEEGVQNIADALVSLEKEVKTEQVQSVEGAAEAKINQDGVGSLQAPEGFLEYGPPGFREYGPPKQDDLLRTAAIAQEPSVADYIESNETRRRRFSPKFRASKNKKAH